VRFNPAWRLLATFLAVLTAPLAATQAPTADLLDRVLAFVDGQLIMQSDVRAFTELGLVDPGDAADPEEAVLTALVERQLILAEVDRYVVAEPTVVEVDARLADVVARAGGVEGFESRLPLLGFTRADLRQIVRDDLRIERYLDGRFPSSALRASLVEDWILSLSARADVLRLR